MYSRLPIASNQSALLVQPVFGLMQSLSRAAGVRTRAPRQYYLVQAAVM